MTWPLFERFPALSALPFVPLRKEQARVEPLRGVAASLGSVVPYAFRDDLAGPGGAKTGRLELLLGEARAAGADAVLTGGSYGSHHVMATAIHARELGMRAFAFLQPQPPSEHARRVLATTLAAGATVIPVDASVSMHSEAAAMQTKSRALLAEGWSPHVIPFGGLGPLGAIAHVDGVVRLAREASPDAIYVPCATASTVAGILVGLALVGLRAKVVAVRVAGTERDWSSPGDWASRVAIRARSVMARLRRVDPSLPPAISEDVVVRHEALGAGYGYVTDEADEAARTLRAAAGIALDSVYTAKACAIFFADLRAGVAGERPLLWITGRETDEIGKSASDVPVPHEELRAFLARGDGDPREDARGSPAARPRPTTG